MIKCQPQNDIARKGRLFCHRYISNTSIPEKTIVPGLTLSDFDFGAVIGVGSFSIVREAILNPIKAQELELPRRFAAKTVTIETTNENSSRHRLQREKTLKRTLQLIAMGESLPNREVVVDSKTIPASEALKKESDMLFCLEHPNIIKPYLFSNDDKNIYLIMEYCEGGSVANIYGGFSQYPHHNTGPDFDTAISYIKQILRGVSYLHNKRIIHRDLKLDNFLLCRDYTIPLMRESLSLKIADFGVSTMLPNEVDEVTSIAGPSPYTSPESLRYGRQSFKSDIYAVGAAASWLLFRQYPQNGLLSSPQLEWKTISTGRLTAAAQNFVESLTAESPEQRPFAVDALQHELLRV